MLILMYFCARPFKCFHCYIIIIIFFHISVNFVLEFERCMFFFTICVTVMFLNVGHTVFQHLRATIYNNVYINVQAFLLAPHVVHTQCCVCRLCYHMLFSYSCVRKMCHPHHLLFTHSGVCASCVTTVTTCCSHTVVCV